jgi:hypothetical protein
MMQQLVPDWNRRESPDKFSLLIAIALAVKKKKKKKKKKQACLAFGRML